MDPRPYLDKVLVPYAEVHAPGYSGLLEAQCVFLHWTAGAVSDSQAQAVVADGSYHACAGPTRLYVASGYAARMAHGGSGRTDPIGIARNGRMTLAVVKTWQPESAPDDTSDWPNHYARAVSIAHPGDSSSPPAQSQLDLFSAGAAAFLISQGCGLGHLMDHDASTARKIDLGWMADRVWDDVARYLTLMTGNGGSSPVDTIVDFQLAPNGGGACLFADGRLITRGHDHYGDPVVATDHDLQQAPAVGFSWTATGKGYTILDAGGYSFDYGDARAQGRYAR